MQVGSYCSSILKPFKICGAPEGSKFFPLRAVPLSREANIFILVIFVFLKVYSFPLTNS